MNVIALAPPAARVPLLGALLERQRTLALYGLALLLLAIPVLVLQTVDGRTLGSGVNVWIKPAKFILSVALFALTSAWFFGYVRPERRGSWPVRAVVSLILIAGTLELLYIGWQAAHGLDSHFNRSAPVYEIMYALMGVFAVALTASVFPLAWEIARRPAPGISRDFAAAVVTGLLLTFILGGALGGYMSAQPAHSVGAVGGAVPIFGWNRAGGDLRVAHFLGIHAQQAIPILALLIAKHAPRTRWLLLGAGSLAYVAVTLGIFFQAIGGRPLLPL